MPSSLEKEMATHSSILPGEFHGQRSPADHSPWRHKESDTTERSCTMLSYLHLEHRVSFFFEQTGFDQNSAGTDRRSNKDT